MQKLMESLNRTNVPMDSTVIYNSSNKKNDYKIHGLLYDPIRLWDDTALRMTTRLYIARRTDKRWFFSGDHEPDEAVYNVSELYIKTIDIVTLQDDGTS